MKEKMVNALLWALSVIVIFMGVMLSLSGFYGVFVLLAGLVLNPSVSSALRIKRGVSVVGFLVLFLAAIMSTPKDGEITTKEVEQNTGSTSQESAEESIPEDDIERANTDLGDLDDSVPEDTEYLTEITWAALESYKCAVERDDYDGDVIASGTYFAEPVFVDSIEGKDVPIIWDIYVSDNDYSSIAELSSDELVATVGGWDKNTGEFTVSSGQYVYVKYTNTLGNPAGALSFTKISEPEEPDGKRNIEPLHLNAGDWIVGVDIEAGRYIITTDESLCILKVRSENEEYPHINTYLEAGDGGYTGTLEDGDLLHCDEPIDLVPYQP